MESIKKKGLHPYHFTPVQNLIQADFPARLDFAHFCRIQQIADPMFLNKVCERHFQYEFKINIWCGVIDNNLLGPFELPTKLNGKLYLDFQQIQLPNYLDDLPLQLRQNMLFMEDGAPAHFSRLLCYKKRFVTGRVHVNLGKEVKKQEEIFGWAKNRKINI
ncbi:hypothetical protein NQ318_008059 [Aromia moschata]|uniref:Uncharacterized protein n=1 Tax=Aromia moschata TaxID=1265417 RepID=A0AAV8YMM3_9CUCU|nr:hypothetical protein NQ318_008059 [Aromia moschata]